MAEDIDRQIADLRQEVAVMSERIESLARTGETTVSLLGSLESLAQQQGERDQTRLERDGEDRAAAVTAAAEKRDFLRENWKLVAGALLLLVAPQWAPVLLSAYGLGPQAHPVAMAPLAPAQPPVVVPMPVDPQAGPVP